MRYYALGDSLTRGSGAGPAGSWAQQVANAWRADGRAVEFHNLAVSGYTADQVLAREVPQLPSARAGDVVSLAVGTNDVHNHVTEAHYQEQVHQILTALSRKGFSGAQVFALPQPNWSQTYDGRQQGSANVLAAIEGFNEALRAEINTFGARFVDLWPLMLLQAERGMWSSGVHPNAEAYTQWAGMVVQDLAAWLPPSDAPAPQAPPTTPEAGGSSRAWRWYAFPAKRLGLVAHPLASGPGPRAEPLTPASVFSAHPEVTTLIPGPMFAGTDARPILRASYLDKGADLDVTGQTSRAAEGWTLSIVGERDAVVKRHREVAPGARVAVQCPFAMVESGRNAWPDTAETNRTWRGCVGVLSDGRLLFGLGDSDLPSLTRRALATDYGRDVRLLWLLYLDGGHEGFVMQQGWRWGSSPAPAPAFLVERGGTPSPMPPVRAGTTRDAGPGGGGGGGSSPSPVPHQVARAEKRDGWGSYLAAGAVALAAGSSPLWVPPLTRALSRKR